MGLDLELKISPTRDDDDDSSSTFELHLAKSTSTHFFWSDQTSSMFILTAKLTGFARDEIAITINGSGTQIEIAWGQPVQKMEITRWTYKKETVTRRFKKIFRIPDGVALDEIKATYNNKESILKILMPKLVDGILGVGIEEVKEQGEVGKAAFESQDCEAEEIPKMNGNTTKMEEDDAVYEDFEEQNAEHEAFPKIEHVEETEEIEKTKGDEMKEIDGDSNDCSGSKQLEKVATKTTEYEANRKNGSKEGIKVAEGTDNHKKEKEQNAQAHNGDVATMINKKPDFKTQSQASIDQEAQVLDPELSQPNQQTRAESGEQETHKIVRKMKELESEKKSEDIESPYSKIPAHDNEEKGVDQKRKSFQTKDETKECKSPLKETHEDSSKEAKQEKNKDSKQFKIRTPILIAGSALLASLVIVVFNMVKSKRREKNMRG